VSADEQRAAALEKGHKSKQELTALRDAIREGRVSAVEVIRGTTLTKARRRSSDRLKLGMLLRAVPGIGSATAEAILAVGGFRASQTLGQLDPSRREQLGGLLYEQLGGRG